jgi:hypothetical protein
MDREVKLSRLHAVLDSLDYPISNAEVRERTADVTLLYADGREPLPAVVERTDVASFDDVSDLEAEIYGHLPIEAVGEPGQSEGDA